MAAPVCNAALGSFRRTAPEKLAIVRRICYVKFMNEQEKLSVLYEYASGHMGTRTAIEQLGLNDYADLVIALSENDLGFPKPVETPALLAHRERARAILQPRLRHGA